MADLTEKKRRENRGIFAVNLGLATNAVLAAIKTFTGIVGHSPALLADGINSTSDVAYYIIVRVFMGLSSKPADDRHPYGHDQLESIAAVIVAAFILATAVAIFWDAINRVYDLWTGKDFFGGASLSALIVALFTIGTKIVLTLVTKRIGQQTKNPAVLALAYDHRNDIFTALAAAIGIFAGRMGFPWVDPLAGAVVAVVILGPGIEILRQSSGDLLDTVPGEALHEQVAEVLRSIHEVTDIEEMLAHRFGPYLVINLTLGVDGALTVAEGDRIATQVEGKLYREIDFLKRVHVHYHPQQK